MKPWMMALIGKQKKLVVQAFSSNATWSAPSSVRLITSLTGVGQNGTPEVVGAWGYTTVITVKFYDQQGNVIGSQVSDLGRTYFQAPPASYCTTEPAQGGATKETCWAYTYFDDTEPATTGADSVGFGRVFPGGVGAPATPSTYSNVTVVPGQSYSIVVPPGGSVTISYYQ